MHPAKDCWASEHHGPAVHEFPGKVSKVRDCKVVQADVNPPGKQGFGHFPDQFFRGPPHTDIDNEGFLFGFSRCPFPVRSQDPFRVFVHWPVAGGNDPDFKVFYFFKRLCSHLTERHHDLPEIALGHGYQVFDVLVINTLGGVSPEKVAGEKDFIFFKIGEHGFRPVEPGGFNKPEGLSP